MNRNRIIEAISDPTKNFIAFFLVGTLVFTIVSDGVSTLFWQRLSPWMVERWGMDQATFDLWLTLALMLVLLGLTYFTNLTRWLRSRLPFLAIKEIQQVNVKPLERTYRGLIVAMSPSHASPAKVAIEFHWQQEEARQLKHCWILCTEKSMPYADQLASELALKGVTQILKLHYGNYEMADPEHPGERLSLLIPDELVDDPNYIQRLVNAIYADAAEFSEPLADAEVIADYTGGTKGITAGILLACSRPERPLQYISQLHQPPRIMAVDVSYEMKPIKQGRRRRRR
ncbi:CRISPR-associated protein [Almyronema epifaneia]|uniref:CRISPR-associated protein n=1 Tax=Almyronema epifaneia S1 TaxID=2991925 RepID=A0ABW6IK27_9CYAN